LVTAIVVGMVGTAVVLSVLQTRLYEGTAQILLQPRQTEALFRTDVRSTQPDPRLTIATEIQILKSEPVRRAVIDKIGPPVPKVGAGRVRDTFVIEVKARSPERSRAEAVVNTYAETYIEQRRRQAADELLTAREELTSKIAEVQANIDTLDVRVADASPAQRDSIRAAQGPRREALAAQLALFQQRSDELEVQAALASGGAQIVARALVPTSPVVPTPLRNGVLAFVFALVLALTVVTVLEYFDDSITTKDDLARAVPGVPVLGTIPFVRDWNRPRRGQRLAHIDGEIPAAEAYRSLRTSVQMLGVERPLSTIQFTSSVSAEGKSTTAANLAMVLADAGQRVVIVDCDLRSPTLHHVFGVSLAPGLTSVLGQGVDLAAALQRVVVGDHDLAVLAAGPIPPNPSELLGSRRTAEVLFKLQSEFDVVVIDSPPALPVTDAMTLSTWVDGVVLVISAGLTKRKQVRATVEVLRQVAAPLTGLVLNRVATSDGYGYGYGYGTYGGARDSDGAKRSRDARRATADHGAVPAMEPADPARTVRPLSQGDPSGTGGR
jgi:succinoglycan biosynthesis transport protein ExoP